MKKLMSKAISLLLVLLACAMAGCVSSQKAPLPAFSAKDSMLQDPFKAKPIVELEIKTIEGSFLCTGAVISSHYVLTAAHCVEGHLTKIVIMDPSTGTRAEAKLAGADESTDLALLVGNFSEFNALPVVTELGPAISVIQRNQGLLVFCGFPRGSTGLCEQVAITGQYEFKYSGTGAFLLPGMSGGPVMDPTSGEIIAVNYGVFGSVLGFSPTVGLFQTLNIPQE